MSRGRLSRRKDPLRKRPSTIAERNPIDKGTPELLDQRKRAHGMPEINAEHPLDSLAAKGLLCPRQNGEETGDWLARNVVARDTAARFGSLHRALYGSSHAQAIDPNARGSSGSAEETDRDLHMERDYTAMRKSLQACGRRIFDAVMNRAVYLRSMPPAETPHWRAEIAAIQAGLVALVERPARMQRAA